MSSYPSEPGDYKRPTKHLTDTHKASLDKVCKDMNCEQMQHAANHINNSADKLNDHAKKQVTMADYKKAMKGNTDVEGTE